MDGNCVSRENQPTAEIAGRGVIMPGPVSDSYDPEWGTSSNAMEVSEAVGLLYHRLTGILGDREPLPILELVRSELPTPITATLPEWEWRLLRFACERAQESI